MMRQAKDGDVQPRLRSILWKEMPPFVRRSYVAWSRFLLHLELNLGEIYLSWTKSPTWNFVGIVGTLGILLTILLFLVPKRFLEESPAKTGQVANPGFDQERRPWELDATLSATSATKSQDYPVELALDRRTRVRSQPSDLVIDELPPRRRRQSPPREEPLAEPEIDWFDSTPEQPKVVTDVPPLLDLEIEFVGPRHRRPRVEEVPDVTVTARTESDGDRFTPHRDFEIAVEDLWRPFDPSQRRDMEPSSEDFLHDPHTTAASLNGDDADALWEPMSMPSSAAPSMEIELELSWDRASRRRRRPPQLLIRNLGREAIPRLDILRGALAETDFSVPQRLSAQTLPELPPGQEHAITRMTAAGRNGRQGAVVSVLVTTFVGNQTTAAEPVAVNEPVPPPPRSVEPRPVRQPQRPHLTLTTVAPEPLRNHKLVSVPMRVMNDGNVTLEGVVIIAEIPPTLEHRHGRTVHFRIGTLSPNEERRTLLLLKPLKPGRSSVKLRVDDFLQTAADEDVVDLSISDDDAAE